MSLQQIVVFFFYLGCLAGLGWVLVKGLSWLSLRLGGDTSSETRNQAQGESARPSPELLSAAEFFRRTRGGRPSQMDMTPYIGHPYACACGTFHDYDPGEIQVLRELRGMKLVLSCPRHAVTCVEVTGVLRFGGFKSMFGVDPESDMPNNDERLRLLLEP